MDRKQKVKLGGKEPEYDIMFEFTDVHTQVLVNPDAYSKEEAEKIEQIVERMSKKIYIDKSYVEFPENKHKDAFIGLPGWESLCSLLKKTKFGKKSSDTADEIVLESFKTIITAYLYSILENCYGYDIEDINIDFEHGHGIDVKFYRDDIQDWKNYPGPWQDWGLDKK